MRRRGRSDPPIARAGDTEMSTHGSIPVAPAASVDTPDSDRPMPRGARRPHVGRTESAAVGALASTLAEHVRQDATHGHMRRDAHPKMHGCVQGTLVVHSIDERLREGIFAAPREYRAWVRFSNAHGVQHDLVLDVRGMALKVLAVDPETGARLADESTTQDFLMATHHAFFVPTPAEFVDFPVALRSGAISLAAFFIRRRLWRGAWGLFRSAVAVAQNPLSMHYYSQTPYRLGRETVKLSLRPLERPGWRGVSAFWLKAVPFNVIANLPMPSPLRRRVDALCARLSAPDRLRHALGRSLASRGAGFELCVQRRAGEHMPIEDATARWSEKESPYVPVATLHIHPQPVAARDPGSATGEGNSVADRMNALGERMMFSPWHGFVQHEPVGGINRARLEIYRSISTLRNAAGGARIAEPSALEFDTIRSAVESGQAPAP